MISKSYFSQVHAWDLQSQFWDLKMNLRLARKSIIIEKIHLILTLKQINTTKGRQNIFICIFNQEYGGKIQSLKNHSLLAASKRWSIKWQTTLCPEKRRTSHTHPKHLVPPAVNMNYNYRSSIKVAKNKIDFIFFLQYIILMHVREKK